MPSLQAKHTRNCALGRPWTPFAAAVDGCTCPTGPVYYVVVREGSRAQKLRAGRNRKDAERALRKTAVAVDEGDFRMQPTIAFSAWGDRWLGSLERKSSTVRSYRPTINLASEVFGSTPVRRLTPEHISRLNRVMRAKELSASTRAKHLRVLGACLQAALRHGFAGRNPVRDLPSSERPRPERKEAAYFTNEETPRLFAEFEPGLHRVLFLTALKTGMRQGELIALRWGDVDLSESVIRVRRSVTDREEGVPKNHERRDVDLIDEVVELLGWWWGECGRPSDEKLVFPGDSAFLSTSTLLRVHLYPALVRAGIPRIGPTGEKRVFHSFRHTFAKRALESGGEVHWLSRHLGHSSLKVTTDIYGHWERGERKRQTAKLAGVFGV